MNVAIIHYFGRRLLGKKSYFWLILFETSKFYQKLKSDRIITSSQISKANNVSNNQIQHFHAWDLMYLSSIFTPTQWNLEKWALWTLRIWWSIWLDRLRTCISCWTRLYQLGSKRQRIYFSWKAPLIHVSCVGIFLLSWFHLSIRPGCAQKQKWNMKQ